MEKQTGLQSSNSTQYMVIQLISKILNVFNVNRYTRSFKDFSKAFDTVDHHTYIYIHIS